MKSKHPKKLWLSFESWLLDPPNVVLHPCAHQVRNVLRILFAVGRDMTTGQLNLYAMSLVYTTILSIVPMLALMFSVLKAFNVQDALTPMLHRFLEPMGEKGIEIESSVLLFVDNMKVGVLGALGLVMLIYVVVSLIQKIERAFNTIWLAPQLRPIGERISHYLGVILIGPVLVVAAISLTASTMNLGFVQSMLAIEPFGSLFVFLTKLMPFIMIIFAFTFFYFVMPNARVSFRSALFGGVISGCSWQASSLIFTTFVVNSTRYDVIYSGFAVGIVLLIWLYMNWLILLLGSSIAFYYQHVNQITRHYKLEACPELIEKVGLDVMRYIALRYDSDSLPVKQVEIEGLNAIPVILNRVIINKLLDHNLLLIAGEKSDMFVPAHSTDQISAAAIFKALRQDKTDFLTVLKVGSTVDELIKKTNDDLYKGLEHVTLRDLIK